VPQTQLKTTVQKLIPRTKPAFALSGERPLYYQLKDDRHSIQCGAKAEASCERNCKYCSR